MDWKRSIFCFVLGSLVSGGLVGAIYFVYGESRSAVLQSQVEAAVNEVKAIRADRDAVVSSLERQIVVRDSTLQHLNGKLDSVRGLVSQDVATIQQARNLVKELKKLCQD